MSVTLVRSQVFSLKEKLIHLERRIGNTPIIKLCSIEKFYSKLEFLQFGNSMKIRPAIHIIKKAVEEGQINQDTVVIESTSGNFGVALAMICKYLGIKFIAVIDVNTPKQKGLLLKSFGAEVVLIDELDETGGYLLNRIRYVENMKLIDPGKYFHPNQYKNMDNPDSYFIGLGEEIIEKFDHLDAVVVSVSTGGSVNGLSRKLKLRYPEITVIAVDVEGSMVFQEKPQKRNLSGLGSSIRSEHILSAVIDRVEILSEDEIINGCKDLLDRELIFAGASSGAAYSVAKRYKADYPDAEVLFICPDDGLSYLESVYHKK